MDAAVSMWFALTLTKPDLVGVAGEVPILLYLSDEETVLAINGSGPAPKAATVEWFRDNDYPLIPEDGFTPAVVPGAFDAWLMTLDLYGTFSLTECLKPSIDIASEGYPIQPTMVRSITASQERFKKEWPSTASIYLPDGRAPHIGQVMKNPDWARTFREMVELERVERRSGRSAALNACRDYFYRGPIAERIIGFMDNFRCRDVYGKENTGLMTLEDFDKYQARIEKPITSNYRGLDVYKCGPWTQGPLQLELYNLLEGFDLKAMGHNSVDYIHTWTECAKLAFADREHYYGDPDFADVPLEMLLSKEYADERRELVDPNEASMLLRPGKADPIELEPTTIKGGFEGDTVHCEAVDPTGQHDLRDAKRRLDKNQPPSSRIRLLHGHTRPAIQPQRGTPQLPTAGQEAQDHPDAEPSNEGGEALHGIRNPWGRRTGPMDEPILPQLRRIRHGCSTRLRQTNRPH